MTPSGNRLAQAALAALLVLPLVAAGGVGQSRSGSGTGVPACQGRQVDGSVVVVTPPDFPTPPSAFVEGRRGARLVDLAVEPVHGRRAWVTDGWSIARTDDAGCSWDVVFSLDDLGDTVTGNPASSASIMALAVPDAAGATPRMYGLVQDLSVPSATSRFGLLVTEDGGVTFDLRGDGIPEVNLAADARGCGDDRPCGLVATGELDTVYVRFASSGGTVVYATEDAGHRFDVRASGTAFNASADNGGGVRGPILTDLEADPSEPNRLWGTGAEDGPSNSLDGSRSYTRYDPYEHFELPLTEIRHLDLTSSGGTRGVSVVGKDAIGRTRAAWSVDDGLTFQPNRILDAMAGEATGILVTDRFVEAVATTSGVFLSGALPTRIRVAGPEHGGLRHLQVVREPNPSVPEVAWGLTDTEVVTFVLDVEPPRRLPPPAQVPVDLGAFDPFDPPAELPGVLQGPTAVDLAPSTARRVTYTLDVPPTGVPVDIFFLLDETGSMQDEFDALAGGIQRIIQDLQDRDVDVHVGLGTYGNGFRYHRYREIGPPDGEFLRRLESIRTGGDGEVAYTGLHQVVTGSGLPRSRAGNGVRAGQDAGWRKGTVHMIVHATDEGLSVESEGPTRQESIDALVRAGVFHLGLIANEVTNGTASQYDWGPMFELAEVTGALAPPGGIDCNRDGLIDVQPGDPIACYLSPLTTNQTVSQADRIDLIPDLASVIVAMLRGFTDVATVSFQVEDSPLVVGISPDVPTSRVDLHKRQVIPATLSLRCTPPLEGVQDTVRLSATTGTRFLASAMVTVSCGVREPTPAAVAPAGAGPRAAAAVAQVPPAPPAPIQAPAPANAAAQAQSAAQANSLVPQVGAAAAQQEQHQVQAAGIGRDGSREQPDTAFQFSARRTSDPAPLTLAAGVAMTAGAAALARRRRAVAVPSRVGQRSNRLKG